MIEILAAGWLGLINPGSFPDAQYLVGWNENPDFIVTRKESPESISKVEIQCDSKNIWPTHPQQYTKEYQFAAWSHYDQGRLSPASYACQRANPTNRFCVMATYANAVFMSDLYNDECGNTYRGYWLVSYLKSDESMGTLFAKGRTVYPKPNSEYEGEFQTGDTYVTKVSDYLFFSGISNLELQQIDLSRQNALKEGYVRSGLQWKRP
jgi:hypothetical protein